MNHPNRSADNIYKPYQLMVAAQCGLAVVLTTITNNPDAGRRLAARSSTGLVHKSLGPNTVTEGGQLTGLVHAAVDFAIDTEQRCIFLESNSAGQYYWLEANTGAPITRALADLLATGVPS